MVEQKTDEKRHAIEALMNLQKQTALDCFGDYYTFFVNFWEIISTDKFQPNWHIEYICREMQEIGLQVIQRQDYDQDVTFNVPPGSSKSSIVSQAFVPWLWLHAPWAVALCTSYSGGLSADHSLKSKDIIKSEKYQTLFQPLFQKLYGFKLRFTKDNESDFRNNFGGARIATSTLGTATGKHAHIILRDDPISAQQAESESYLLRAARFNGRTLSNRKKDPKKCPIITIMQRLNEKDTTGIDIQTKGDKLRLICLPAELSSIVNPPELAKYYVDGLLDPVRLSRNVLENYKKELGSIGYAGQYKQTPYDEEGSKIKRAWYRTISEGNIPAGLEWHMFIDGAYTDQTKNDPSGILITAYDPFNRVVYIRKFIHRHYEMPDMIKLCIALKTEYNISMVYIEPKASGHSLVQMLRYENDMNVSVIDTKLVSQGKTARLNTAAPRVESGRVILVEDNWHEDFFGQVCGFPRAAHDEAVDLQGYAIDKYFGSVNVAAAVVTFGE